MILGFPGGTGHTELTCQRRKHKRCGFIPGWGGSPGGGNGNPLQYSCLANPLDRGAWWGTVPIGSQRVRHDRSDLHTPTHTQRFWSFQLYGILKKRSKET